VGHSRLLAARKLGLLEVPVHVAADLSEAQCRAYRIADNRAGEEARWDDKLLKMELSELGVLAGLTALDPKEIKRLGLTEDAPQDAIPAPPVSPVARLGQIWQLDKHRLMCGDSTRPEYVSRLMGDERAALFATDPPYAVGYAGGSHPATKANRAKANHDKDRSKVYHEAGRTTFNTAMKSEKLTRTNRRGGAVGRKSQDRENARAHLRFRNAVGTVRFVDRRRPLTTPRLFPFPHRKGLGISGGFTKTKQKIWSHPPDSNRRPADYETNVSPYSSPSQPKEPSSFGAHLTETAGLPVPRTLLFPHKTRTILSEREFVRWYSFITTTGQSWKFCLRLTSAGLPDSADGLLRRRAWPMREPAEAESRKQRRMQWRVRRPNS